MAVGKPQTSLRARLHMVRIPPHCPMVHPQTVSSLCLYCTAYTEGYWTQWVFKLSNCSRC